MKGLIVDLFAGGGGASLGIEMATGRSPDVAINHDPVAIAIHTANHPETRHMGSSVWQADPRDVVGREPVALLWASPDCFPSGTMILTDRGYRPIERIVEGDRVLTHDGRYRRVYATMRSMKAVRQIDIQGVPAIMVTEEHPFLARAMCNVWDNARRRYVRTLGTPSWVVARDLRAGHAPMNAAGGNRHFCASPCVFAPLPIPAVGGRGIDVDEALMWLAGRYVGDGWSRIGDGRAELVITCSKSEAGDLVKRLSAWPRAGQRSAYGELAWHQRETKTARQFATNHRGLVEWLRHEFGHGANAKGFPAWAFSAPEPLRRALLAGYVSADGSQFSTGSNDVTETVTISKALALSTKALVESLGHTATVSKPRRNSSVIEGRVVTARPSYLVRWRAAPLRTQTVREGLHNWSRVQSISPPSERIAVFNLSVEQDESYVADGIVVHNCKHFSKAKGRAPVARHIRDLAWVAVLWAQRARPTVIMLENVEEFRTWGPVLLDGRPCPDRAGATFLKWVRELRRLGYKVEHRELRACDYGVPTIRKRLFVIARCDGRPIVWPQPTHGPGLAPFRTAAECIDWSIPCPSIFGRKRPLAENTLKRIAAGIRRYVVECPEPFIVGLAHGKHRGRPGPGDRSHGLDEPVRTIHAGGGNHALVSPLVVPVTRSGVRRGHPVGEPLRTITTAKGGEQALVVPWLVPRYGERPGQEPRTMPLDRPGPTVVPTANGGSLVAAFLAQHNGGMVGHDAREPVSTITVKGSQQALVATHLMNMKGSDRSAQPADAPCRTISAGGTHLAEVRAFLVKYYGTAFGQPLTEPLHTVTTKDRYGLVTIAGQDWQIIDIGMRMLTPRELARAQGFPDSYVIEEDLAGRAFTKVAQVRMIGNSVCPPLAAALVRANLGLAEVEGAVA